VSTEGNIRRELWLNGIKLSGAVTDGARLSRAIIDDESDDETDESDETEDTDGAGMKSVA
jgi:hypothetical protein